MVLPLSVFVIIGDYEEIFMKKGEDKKGVLHKEKLINRRGIREAID